MLTSQTRGVEIFGPLIEAWLRTRNARDWSQRTKAPLSRLYLW